MWNVEALKREKRKIRWKGFSKINFLTAVTPVTPR